MIAIDNNFTSLHRAAVRRARAEKIRTVRLEPDLYYVARREQGHGQYLVRLFHRGGSVTAVCSTVFNQACPSSLGHKCCVHIAAAVLRAIKYGRNSNKKLEAA